MSDSETASDLDFAGPNAKRRRIETDRKAQDENDQSKSSSRDISPPPLRRGYGQRSNDDENQSISSLVRPDLTILPSPFQLTKIHDLQEKDNIHTVTLTDILGDPMIMETWQFNFLFDLDFLMSAFDSDVRNDVKVNVVHGHWKNDENRQALLEGAAKYPNMKLITAHMPEPFGTHHTKMMVLFRRDDTAQIVIHTANMISRDWKNMSQAVWTSPFLPLLPELDSQPSDDVAPIGSGACFKKDFLNYIGCYEESRTGALSAQLKQYDFSSIRGALVGSVPKKQSNRSTTPTSSTRYGWLGLQDIMRRIPTATHFSSRPVIVAQVSSIATLGQTSGWIDHFFNILNCSGKAFGKPPIPRIVFPTADEIRRSLDGYFSGGSIHTKIQSKAQQKQVEYLRPRLCYWAGDGDGVPEMTSESAECRREAGRRRAAPHIKTYVRFTNSEMEQIDWAMVTSANLSTQAWGGLPNKEGEVKISSYELGVVVWPALLGPEAAVDTAKTIMVPTFKTDVPVAHDDYGGAATVVGFRMPYDLPLVRYTSSELPWCATSDYTEPDWMGYIWKDYTIAKVDQSLAEASAMHMVDES